MKKDTVIKDPSALVRMDACINQAVIVPFNGKPITILARELSYAQIKSCGTFSLIETMIDKINKKTERERLERKGKKADDFHEIVKQSELYHNIVKMSMLSPKYDELIEHILRFDENYTNGSFKETLNNIQQNFTKLQNTKKKSKAEKLEMKTLQNEFARIEMMYKFCLPSDFLSFMFSFALQVDKSDIKLVTENMLYEAAVLAKLGNGNPVDHLPGIWTEFNKVDINNRAWIIYFDRKKEEKGNSKR